MTAVRTRTALPSYDEMKLDCLRERLVYKRTKAIRAGYQALVDREGVNYMSREAIIMELTRLDPLDLSTQAENAIRIRSEIHQLYPFSEV